MRFTQAQLACIKSLETKDGHISAKRMVTEAKNKKSPLHVLFDWDLKRAAERDWLQRARVIIGAVTIQVTHHETVLKNVAYVVDTSMPGEYRSVIAMRSDTVSARESLVYTLETASGHLRRCFDLAASLGLESEIDHLLAQVAGVVRLAREKAA